MTTRGKTRDDYMELVQKFPLQTITDDETLAEAEAIIGSLFDKKRTVGESIYFDTLCQLVQLYDDESCPIEPLAEGEMLAYLIEQRGLSRAEFCRQVGVSESTISNCRGRTSRDEQEAASEGGGILWRWCRRVWRVKRAACVVANA